MYTVQVHDNDNGHAQIKVRASLDHAMYATVTDCSFQPFALA